MPYGSIARAYIGHVLHRVADILNGQENNQAAQENAGGRRPWWSKHPEEEHQRCSPDHKHKTKERRNWLYQNGLALATLLVAIIVAKYAYLTYCQTRRQADAAQNTYVATARAWLDVGVDPGGISLKWAGEHDVISAIDLSITNHSNAPAIEAQAFTKVLPSHGDFFGKIPLKNICLDRSSGGAVVFPQATPSKIRAPFVVHIPNEFVIEPRVVQNRTTSADTALDVAVCVNYKILGDEASLHYTGHLFGIDRPLDGGYTSDLRPGYSDSSFGLIAVPKSNSDSAD